MNIKQLIFLLNFLCITVSDAQSVFKEDLLDSIVSFERKHKKLQQENITLAATSNYDMKFARIEVTPSCPTDLF